MIKNLMMSAEYRIKREVVRRDNGIGDKILQIILKSQILTCINTPVYGRSRAPMP